MLMAVFGAVGVAEATGQVAGSQLIAENRGGLGDVLSRSDFFGVAVCHQDCESDSDCATGNCWTVDEDGLGVCLGAPPATPDGGVSDDGGAGDAG